jgi:hypothetical protein
MSPRRTNANDAADVPERRGPVTGERELIVVAGPARDRGISERAGAPSESGALAAIVADAGARIRPLFGASPERLRNETARATAGAPAADVPDLSVYYRVEAPDEKLDDLAAQLRRHESVAAAYVKPAAEPAVTMKTPASTPQYRPPSTSDRITDSTTQPLNDMLPRVDEAPPATPSFVSRQIYLNAAPAGIDAIYAWTQPGGSGAGVRIIDIEGEWRFTHEDLTINQGGVVGGTQPNDLSWRNHGTAVIGEFGGDRNTLGITGICPDANTRAISIFGLGSAPAIRRAADLLGPGDIILIELHRPGPRATGIGQQGFIAIEWWPDDFDAIRYATARGVIVVEAAGNGAENLDAAIYDTPGPGFPAGWSNPFRRGARDSGAILVGAGAPPPGTHGRDHGPDRSRLDFSNYGAMIDAQGWGREVTTAGYGDLQGGSNENYWYTDQFSGTSSASPIVVGALGCIQGNRRARSIATLTPATARTLLRTTGTPQQDAPGRPATQRIGNRPNLRQVVGGGVPVVLSVPVFRYWNPLNTDHFYTTNWAELGAGKYGYIFEGIQCYSYPSQVPGSIPLYRYWNAPRGDHFYTTSWAELGSGKFGYAYEGVQTYVFSAAAANRVPLYRYWNAVAGDHFYTTNWAELGWGKYGYTFEGVQCYVATQVRPPADTDVPDAMAIDMLAGQEHGSNGDAATELASAAPSFGMADAPPSSFVMPELGPGAVVPASFASLDSTGQSIGQASSFTTSGASRASSFEVKQGDRTGVTLTIRIDSGSSQT